MKPGAKAALIGSGILAIGGLAYYFYKSKQCVIATGITQAINTITQSSIAGLTLADLQKKNWVNQNGVTGLSKYLVSFDPASGAVGHSESAWKGTLIDANTIAWTRSGTGENSIWTAQGSMAGLGSVVNARLLN